MTKVNVCYVKAGDELNIPTENIICTKAVQPRMGMQQREPELEIWFLED